MSGDEARIDTAGSGNLSGGTADSVGAHPARGEDRSRAAGLVLANVRTLVEREGDLMAQLMSIKRGEARLRELVAKYGEPAVVRHMHGLQDYSERNGDRARVPLPGTGGGDNTLDRRVRGPYGLAGGEAEKPDRNTLMRGRKAQTLLAKTRFEIAAGDLLRIETPGGGGWGKAPT